MVSAPGELLLFCELALVEVPGDNQACCVSFLVFLPGKPALELVAWAIRFFEPIAAIQRRVGIRRSSMLVDQKPTMH
ncbi:hypothetical protein SAMN04488518_1063 [Pseudovibrio ascidiaceicola]|uniref:Uncharacterized protein n=1 Tax=Pseudovibrio ascidiaceicola TaxID=285279 RepID=A0A1I4A6Q5_9HYPH|nr:hypothetical protein [Pseudovibrio ascidiaceicola]SFK51621.1 hypothetical protein SAMN04488518_1063 [Pseudovibrio ascidiaceicola]